MRSLLVSYINLRMFECRGGVDAVFEPAEAKNKLWNAGGGTGIVSADCSGFNLNVGERLRFFAPGRNGSARFVASNGLEFPYGHAYVVWGSNARWQSASLGHINS